MKSKLVFPKAPTFNSIEEERQHRKERLAAAFRLFAKYGFDDGLAGHITVRDPEKPDHYWVNQFGMHFSQIKVSNLVLVNHNGDIVEGIVGERYRKRRCFCHTLSNSYDPSRCCCSRSLTFHLR